MHRFSSRQLGFAVLVSLATLLLSVASFGQSQSLGDIARENREKKATEESSATPPKVITNKTLPNDPDAITTATDEANHNAPGARRSRAREEQEASHERANEQHAEAQSHQRIVQQASVVTNLRMRVDRLKASIRFTDPNYGNSSAAYSAGVNYNRAQARRLDRLAQLQQQLDREKYKLEQMQEAARHAGMHTMVYEP
jgi:CCR4-NOT transcriptional regulation complex NOT5 subunit